MSSTANGISSTHSLTGIPKQIKNVFHSMTTASPTNGHLHYLWSHKINFLFLACVGAGQRCWSKVLDLCKLCIQRATTVLTHAPIGFTQGPSCLYSYIAGLHTLWLVTVV